MKENALRVCIIDDNETNLMLFEQIVRRLGDDLSIECFADPIKAVASCVAALPDLILVDYMMPGMDGHEVLRRLRALPAARDVPMVMVTAANERSVRQTALELGATDFIAKPIETGEVKARLSNLLALRRSHLQLADRNIWLADEVRRATRTIIDREEELIFRLSRAAEFRDPETGAHISRMAHFSMLIAAALGMPTDDCDLMLRSAPMHDIGKLGIPDGILLKPGRLDEQEMAVMRRHPQIGFSILDGSASRLIRMGAEIALTHHEKFDGTGFPAGLAGDTIPLSGRIVAVADVFDALTSVRPYKRAWEVNDSVAFLKENAGTHFDPACVEAFLAVWDEVLKIRERFADPVEILI